MTKKEKEIIATAIRAVRISIVNRTKAGSEQRSAELYSLQDYCDNAAMPKED